MKPPKYIILYQNEHRYNDWEVWGTFQTKEDAMEGLETTRGSGYDLKTLICVKAERMSE